MNPTLRTILIILAALVLMGAGALLLGWFEATESESGSAASRMNDNDARPAAAIDPQALPAAADTATFAGGCFWCMEPPFEKLDGVLAATSGYAGGDEPNPTYEEVSSGQTGHAEVVQVIYDAGQISYGELLDVYWRNIDPLTPNRQFCDVGAQYRSAIFYHNEEQRRLAEETKRTLEEERFDRPIVTEIEPLEAFYPAEEYHQDYYQKNPERYRQYREGCGRDERLEALWG